MMAKRITLVVAVAALVLAACGTAAPAENGCGTNGSPCRGAGNTLPAGWAVTDVKVSDGRIVTCITWNNPGAAFPNPGLSCDWSPR